MNNYLGRVKSKILDNGSISKFIQPNWSDSLSIFFFEVKIHYQLLKTGFKSTWPRPNPSKFSLLHYQIYQQTHRLWKWSPHKKYCSVLSMHQWHTLYLSPLPRPLHFLLCASRPSNKQNRKQKETKKPTNESHKRKDRTRETPRGWRGNRTRAWCRSWCCTPWVRRWARWCCTSVSANWTLIGAQIRKPWSRRRPSPSALVAPLSTPIPMRFYFFLVFLYCHTPIEAQLVPRD